MSVQKPSIRELLVALMRAELLLLEAETNEGACVADLDGTAPQDDALAPDPAEAPPPSSITDVYRPLNQGGRPWEPLPARQPPPDRRTQGPGLRTNLSDIL